MLIFIKIFHIIILIFLGIHIEKRIRELNLSDPDLDPNPTGQGKKRRVWQSRGHKATLNKGAFHPLNLLSTFDID